MNTIINKKLSKIKVQSCIISKENETIFEYSKNDKILTNPQKINSCTKSVTGALLGICIDRGLLHIEDPIHMYFNQHHSLLTGMKQTITIQHLITMSVGFDWPEFGEWNCFAPMVFQEDIVRFILERDLIALPGQSMNYNSGCSHLLSYIIQKAVGTSLANFAEIELFKPLGITDYTWYDIQGINLGADGLRLLPKDMIKFGQLYLNHGVYNEKRILSACWITDSLVPRYITYENIGYYGYHWWTSDFISKDGLKTIFHFALGYGGQYIILVPSLSIVIGITSNNYKDSLSPLRFMKEEILSSI